MFYRIKKKIHKPTVGGISDGKRWKNDSTV